MTASKTRSFDPVNFRAQTLGWLTAWYGALSAGAGNLREVLIAEVGELAHQVQEGFVVHGPEVVGQQTAPRGLGCPRYDCARVVAEVFKTLS